ncbi:MAG: hypothetical protein R2824_30335 [Saprospiraceae bacterium]|nr:hypothetical protein [Lewinella sp.]
MKKTLLLTLLAILTFSCQRQVAENDQSYLIRNADRILSAYNAGTLPRFQKARHVIGDLSLEEKFFDDQKMIYLTVDDYTFTIQNAKDWKYKFPKGKVEILFLEKELIINDLRNGHKTLFTVSEEMSDYVSPLEVRAVKEVVGLGTVSYS